MADWMREVWRNTMDVVEPMNAPAATEVAVREAPMQLEASEPSSTSGIAADASMPALPDGGATQQPPMHVEAVPPAIPMVQPTAAPDGTALAQQIKECYDRVSAVLASPLESKQNEISSSSLHDFQQDALQILQALTEQRVGGILYDNTCSGRTTTCAAFCERVLHSRASAAAAPPPSEHGKILVLVGRRSLMRWESTFARTCQSGHTSIVDRASIARSRFDEHADPWIATLGKVILCPFEDCDSVLSDERFASLRYELAVMAFDVPIRPGLNTSWGLWGVCAGGIASSTTRERMWSCPSARTCGAA